MSANPNLVNIAIKAALAMCAALTVLCLQLTAGVSPAAGSAQVGRSPSDPMNAASSAGEQNTTGGLLTAGQISAVTTASIECPLSMDYPESVRRWCDPMVELAGQYYLPPELIAALILQESGGDPLAYSSSGAVGLMQIMPRDGLAAEFMCQNGRCFASRPTIAELQDPEYNLEFGVRMLAGLLERTGDLREALKAYGPMDVGHTYADIVLSIYENYR
jgi:soluble lytic murein transglycosylase-like protein